jgi:hypothetical protein
VRIGGLEVGDDHPHRPALARGVRLHPQVAQPPLELGVRSEDLHCRDETADEDDLPADIEAGVVVDPLLRRHDPEPRRDHLALHGPGRRERQRHERCFVGVFSFNREPCLFS